MLNLRLLAPLNEFKVVRIRLPVDGFLIDRDELACAELGRVHRAHSGLDLGGLFRQRHQFRRSFPQWRHLHFRKRHHEMDSRRERPQ